MTDLSRFAAALADRYRIERELGQGGMATVYLAHDLRHDRHVAIKVLRPELSAVIGAERFLREIKTIANLQHPHILGLIDSGEVQGTAFYVMPFVEGESLRDRLNREKQLPIEDAVRVATEVAAALDYAHRHGVIHRDIKPENILLHDGSAVVADFGIALAVSTAGGNRMTETGMSLGTPHYMSPEQAMGERDIDQRSDTFSLGCVLYEMLLGEPPFTGVTAQAVVAKIMTADAPSLTRQRRSIPQTIDKAVHRALERLPADRFDTTADFAAALKASSSQSLQRSRRPIVLAGLVLVLLAIAAAGYLWKVRSRGGAAESDNRKVVAILPMRNISQDTAQEYFSEGMTEEITSQLAKVASLRVLGRAATAQYDTVSNRLKRMSNELGVGSVVDGSVRLAGDRVRINVELTDVATGQSLWSEQYERQMSDLFAVQADVAHQVANALQATLTESEAKRIAHAPTSSTAAYEIYLRARELRPQTRSENRVQAGLLRQAIEIDNGFALAYAYLARNYMFRSVAGEPAWLDSGFVAARKAIAVDSELSDGYFALGDLQSYRFQFADARRSYLKALELKPSHDGVMADLANVYVSLGRYDEALDWSLRSAQLNPNHPHGPYHVGLALIGLDDDSVTARYLLAAERKRPSELRVQGLLSWLELRMGHTAAALGRARRMIANDPDNTEGPPILAELAALAGLKEAEPLLARLVAADPGTPSQYDAAGLRSFYALTLHQRGAEREASSLWRQSAAAAQQQLKAGAEGPAAPMELAAINAIQGHTAEAMDWLEQGYRAGWRDAHQLALDPFFASIRQEPRYKSVLANMRQEVAEMRKRAADAHPELWQGPPHE